MNAAGHTAGGDLDMSTRVLTVDDVSYRYPWRKEFALADCSWRCSTTERVLLLGRNGAGKSTFFRLLAGLSSPRRGTVQVESGGDVSPGLDNPTSRFFRRRPEHLAGVSLMPQTIAPLGGLRVREQVAYAAWLAGQPHALAQLRTEKALAQVDLTEKADDRTSTLSGGQLRRVGLAEVLVAESSFLLLDEPFAGLDPIQQDRLKRIVATVTDRGLIVSTHQIDDIVDVLDRVTILDHGHVRADEPLGHLAPGGPRQAYVKDLFARTVIGDPTTDDE